MIEKKPNLILDDEYTRQEVMSILKIDSSAFSNYRKRGKLPARLSSPSGRLMIKGSTILSLWESVKGVDASVEPSKLDNKVGEEPIENCQKVSSPSCSAEKDIEEISCKTSIVDKDVSVNVDEEESSNAEKIEGQSSSSSEYLNEEMKELRKTLDEKNNELLSLKDKLNKMESWSKAEHDSALMLDEFLNLKLEENAEIVLNGGDIPFIDIPPIFCRRDWRDRQNKKIKERCLGIVDNANDKIRDFLLNIRNHYLKEKPIVPFYADKHMAYLVMEASHDIVDVASNNMKCFLKRYAITDFSSVKKVFAYTISDEYSKNSALGLFVNEEHPCRDKELALLLVRNSLNLIMSNVLYICKDVSIREKCKNLLEEEYEKFSALLIKYVKE